MAWKAKTLASTLMTVALEIVLGLFSAMTNRFGYAKANRNTVFSPYFSRDQFRTPLHTFAGSIALSGLSFLALSSKTSAVSG